MSEQRQTRRYFPNVCAQVFVEKRYGAVPQKNNNKNKNPWHKDSDEDDGKKREELNEKNEREKQLVFAYFLLRLRLFSLWVLILTRINGTSEWSYEFKAYNFTSRSAPLIRVHVII